MCKPGGSNFLVVVVCPGVKTGMTVHMAHDPKSEKCPLNNYAHEYLSKTNIVT